MNGRAALKTNIITREKFIRMHYPTEKRNQTHVPWAVISKFDSIINYRQDNTSHMSHMAAVLLCGFRLF